MSACLDLGFHELFRPSDWIYRWIDDRNVADGRILEAHWPTSQWKNGLSCDWGILAGPDQTALRLGAALPAYVLRFSVQDCIDLEIDVHHSPVIDEANRGFNLAHCLLRPRNTSKSAIRNVRSALQAPSRGTLLHVQPSVTNGVVAFLRRWHPRQRAALRYIETSSGQRT